MCACTRACVCVSPERVTWWGLLWITSTAKSLFCRVQAFPTASACIRMAHKHTLPHTHTYTQCVYTNVYTQQHETNAHLVPVRFFIDVLILAVRMSIWFLNLKACWQQTVCMSVCVCACVCVCRRQFDRHSRETPRWQSRPWFLCLSKQRLVTLLLEKKRLDNPARLRPSRVNNGSAQKMENRFQSLNVTNVCVHACVCVCLCSFY